MSIISRIGNLFTKEQTSPDKYLESSIRIVEGSGQLGAKARPFNYEVAIRRFVGWAYAAAMLNAQAVSSTPLRLFVRTRRRGRLLFETRKVSRKRKSYLLGDAQHKPSKGVVQKLTGFGDDFEEITDNHPLLNLLNTVNPWANGFDLTTLRIIHGELTGNAYLHPVIDAATGVPVELWPMPPQWVEIIPDRENFIDGYVYGANSTEKQRFEVDEVIHFKRPHPNNLFYGYGHIEAGWGVLNLDQANHEMDLAFVDNNARPDYAMIVKAGATGDDLDRFEAKIDAQLRGRANTGRFVSITGDVQLMPLNFPPKDLAGRDDIVEEIAAVFGVPISLLKANDPNLASAQTGFAAWKANTILPLIRMDEETLNAALLPLFGIEDDACLAYDNPVPADKAFDQQKSIEDLNVGKITRNEARVAEGLEPVDDENADELLVGGQPLDTLGQQPSGPFGFLSMQAPAAKQDDEPVAQPKPESLPAREIDPAKVAAIVEKVQAGTLPRDAAIAILVESYGIDEVRAAAMVGDGLKMHREPHETFDQCMSRSMSILTNMGMDETDADSIATVVCSLPPMIGPEEVEPGEPAPIDGGEGEQGDDDEQSFQLSEDIEELAALVHDPFHDPNCKCGACDHTKEGDTGDADDTRRESESERAIKRLQASIDEVLEKEAKAVAKFIKGGAKTLREDLAKILEKFTPELREAMLPELEEMIKTGALGGLQKIGASSDIFSVTNPAVRAFIDNYTVRLAGQIQRSTIRALSTTLGEGLDAGETLADLTKRVQETGAFSRNRAEMIARSESARANVEGEREAWKQSGVVKGKRWLLSANACEFCRAAAKSFEAEDKAIGLDDEFYAKGTDLKGLDGGTLKLNYTSIQGPPLHPNCRCDLIAVVDTT